MIQIRYFLIFYIKFKAYLHAIKDNCLPTSSMLSSMTALLGLMVCAAARPISLYIVHSLI